MEKFDTLSKAEEAYNVLLSDHETIKASMESINAELNDLKQKNEALESEKEQLSEDLESAKADAQAKQEDVNSLNAYIDLLKEDEITAQASAGDQPVEGDSRNLDEETIREQFKNISNPADKNAFYQKHRDILNPFK